VWRSQIDKARARHIKKKNGSKKPLQFWNKVREKKIALKARLNATFFKLWQKIYFTNSYRPIGHQTYPLLP